MLRKWPECHGDRSHFGRFRSPARAKKGRNGMVKASEHGRSPCSRVRKTAVSLLRSRCPVRARWSVSVRGEPLMHAAFRGGKAHTLSAAKCRPWSVRCCSREISNAASRDAPNGHCLPNFDVRPLELIAHAGLHLPGIPKAAANRAVEVEQQAIEGRVLEVVAAKNVEHLDDRFHALPASHRERA